MRIKFVNTCKARKQGLDQNKYSISGHFTVNFLNSLLKLPTCLPPTNPQVLDLSALSLHNKSSLTSQLCVSPSSQGGVSNDTSLLSNCSVSPCPGRVLPGGLGLSPNHPYTILITLNSLNSLNTLNSSLQLEQPLGLRGFHPPCLGHFARAVPSAQITLPLTVLPALTLPSMGNHLGLSGAATGCSFGVLCFPHDSTC